MPTKTPKRPRVQQIGQGSIPLEVRQQLWRSRTARKAELFKMVNELNTWAESMRHVHLGSGGDVTKARRAYIREATRGRFNSISSIENRSGQLQTTIDWINKQLAKGKPIGA